MCAPCLLFASVCLPCVLQNMSTFNKEEIAKELLRCGQNT